MPNEPRWLPIEVVIEHNRLEVEATGERHLLWDYQLLDSALARPKNFYGFGQDDVAALAVALLNGMARAHAFEQGNKRTAFATMRLFLQANGYDTSFDDSAHGLTKSLRSSSTALPKKTSCAPFALS